MLPARENPFRVERVESLAFRPLGTSWPGLMTRIAAMGYRAAVVGPDGSGKTTLLSELAGRLGTEGFRTHRLWMNADTRLHPQIPRGLTRQDIILFDGADHLPAWRWRRFWRAVPSETGLIITSHRHGLLPPLLETRTTWELLADLVGQLTGTQADPEDCRDLLLRHRGNVRDALREMYDRSWGYTPAHG